MPLYITTHRATLYKARSIRITTSHSYTLHTATPPESRTTRPRPPHHISPMATPLRMATPPPYAHFPLHLVSCLPLPQHPSQCELISKFSIFALGAGGVVGVGRCSGSVDFPFTGRELCGTAHNTGRVTWGITAGHPVRHLILLTIPTPSKVKIAVPKNNKKVFQLATRGRWLWCGV